MVTIPNSAVVDCSFTTSPSTINRTTISQRSGLHFCIADATESKESDPDSIFTSYSVGALPSTERYELMCP
jgi:hypothetical protein